MSIELITIDNASPEQFSAINEITREFELKLDILKVIKNEFMKQLKIGLEKERQNLSMVPSFGKKSLFVMTWSYILKITLSLAIPLFFAM